MKNVFPTMALLASLLSISGCDTAKDAGDVGRFAWRLYSCSHARGTAALRAEGCDDACVVDGDEMLADEEKSAKTDAGVGILVLCEPQGARVPTCDRVAAVYVSALGGAAPKEFTVSVTMASSTKGCDASYTARGIRK
ncbi:MAG: hypothetical protein R3B13_14055 [Polyangiaceae bacterium]